MAAKPSTAAEKALQKIQDQVTCGICLEPYKQPKLLKCFHVYCEQCLHRLAHKKKTITCPQCRQDTPLPVGGVQELQGAFYIHNLFDIEDVLKKEGFSSNCHKHPEKEAECYCTQCDQLVCSSCIVSDHRNHKYDLLSELLAKKEKVIFESLKPVGEQIATLERAVESVNTRRAEVVERKTAVVEDIRTAMAHLQQALEVRKRKLVDQAEQMAQHKLDNLEAQRDRFELQLAQLRSCQNSLEQSWRTCSEGKILRMEDILVKQANDLAGSFEPETFTLSEQANLNFANSLPELVKTCQQFGEVYCHPPCPEKCQASGEGVKVAMRGQTVVLSVKALDTEGRACLGPVDSLRCELVASDGTKQVSGTVKRRNQNIYDISYQPLVTGKHQLHILINEQPILNSPFTVTVLPNLTAPANTIEGLNGPWGIAVKDGGEVVVTEYNSDCVSIIGSKREKKSFGAHGLGPGRFYLPEGVAIDGGGNILVADHCNHRIQQFSPTGKHLKTVGAKKRKGGPLPFSNPLGVMVHPQSCMLYITEYSNHRVQVLNPDFTYANSFGRQGSNDGEFNHPSDISTDTEGNVYVADSDNHRIQVFAPDGTYLRQFGRKGEGEGELKQPVGITVSSHNMVFVSERGNNRVSIFSTEGEFIKSFGKEGEGSCQFSTPCGIELDKNGAIYVCDVNNRCIHIFS